MLTWVLGNLLGGLAGYYRQNRTLRFAGLLAMAFHPIPYYIVAFLLLIVFGYLVAGAADQRRLQDEHGARLELGVHRQPAAATASCRSLSLALVGLGGWFMGMRSLVSNIVTEDYVTLCRAAGGVERLAHPVGSTSCATPWCRRSPGSPCRSARSSTAPSSPSRCSGYPGVGTLLVVGRPCRRLQPGARRHHACRSSAVSVAVLC